MKDRMTAFRVNHRKLIALVLGSWLLVACTVNNGPTAQDIARQVEADMAQRQPAAPTPAPTPESAPTTAASSDEVAISSGARDIADQTIGSMTPNEQLDAIAVTLDSQQAANRQSGRMDEADEDGTLAAWARGIKTPDTAFVLPCTETNIEWADRIAADLNELANWRWTTATAGGSSEQRLADDDARLLLTAAFVGEISVLCRKRNAAEARAMPQPQHHHQHHHAAPPPILTPQGMHNL
jgi:hypothetical protein